MDGSPAWAFGQVLTNPHHKNVPCYEMFTKKKTYEIEILFRKKLRAD